MCTTGNVIEGLGVIGGAALSIGSLGALAGPGIAIASAGLSAGAAIDAGKATHDAADRQAAIDDQNAKLANEQADIALADAQRKVGQIGEQGSRIQAQQKLAAASGNVDVTSGSAAEDQVDTSFVTSHMQNLAMLEGARTAYGYRSQSLNFRAQGAAKRAAGADAQTASYWAAAGSAVAGAAGVYTAGKKLNWWGKAATTEGGG